MQLGGGGWSLVEAWPHAVEAGVDVPRVVCAQLGYSGGEMRSSYPDRLYDGPELPANILGLSCIGGEASLNECSMEGTYSLANEPTEGNSSLPTDDWPGPPVLGIACNGEGRGGAQACGGAEGSRSPGALAASLPTRRSPRASTAAGSSTAPASV